MRKRSGWILTNIDDLEWILTNIDDLESSVIRKVAYFSTTNTLRIIFKSDRVYDYYNVSKETFESFVNSRSIGRYYNANIKQNYASEYAGMYDDIDPMEIPENKKRFQREKHQVGFFRFKVTAGEPWGYDVQRVVYCKEQSFIVSDDSGIWICDRPVHFQAREKVSIEDIQKAITRNYPAWPKVKVIAWKLYNEDEYKSFID